MKPKTAASDGPNNNSRAVLPKADATEGLRDQEKEKGQTFGDTRLENIPDDRPSLPFDGSIQNQTKKCSACKVVLGINFFHKKGDRLDSRCRDCVKKIGAKKRKMKKLSKLGSAKRRTKMIDIVKVFESIANHTSENCTDLSRLVREFVIEIILDMPTERKVA